MPLEFNPLSKFGFDLTSDAASTSDPANQIKIVDTGPLVADTEKFVLHGIAYTDYLFFAIDSDGQEVTLQTLKPYPQAPYTGFVIESAIDVPEGLKVVCIGINREGEIAPEVDDTFLENQLSYGFEINNNTPDPTVTAVGNATLHSTLPIQSKIKRAVLRDDGSVKYYLGETNSDEQVDGQPANTDGTDGQVMTFKPGYYFKFNRLGNIDTIRFSEFQLPGFEYREPAWVGAYKSYIDGGGKLCSISGVKPTTNKTISQYRAAAALRGAGWCQVDHDTQYDLDMLFTCEYLSLNSQAVLSAGVTNGETSDWNNYNNQNPVFNTGLTNILGNGTGELAQTIPNFVNGNSDFNTQVFAYRGIENLWGEVWEFRDGVNIHNSSNNGSQILRCKNPNLFASDTFNNYELIGYATDTNGFGIKMVEGSFIPTTAGGGSEIYLADFVTTFYQYVQDSGFYIVINGGRLGSGSKAGIRFSGLSDKSDINTNVVGSRLCYKPDYAS